jgi:hypothetical protein
LVALRLPDRDDSEGAVLSRPVEVMDLTEVIASSRFPGTNELSLFYSAPRGYNALRCDHQGQFAFFAPRPNCAHTGASGITTVFSEDRAQPGSSGELAERSAYKRSY